MSTPRWTVREALEQAHVLYMAQYEDAVKLGDEQGKNFWGSHAETVRSVLDTIELCPQCEAKGLRPEVPCACSPKTRCGVCGWPLAAMPADGCTVENCSQRPPPPKRTHCAQCGGALP